MLQKRLNYPHYLWYFFYWLLLVDSINGFFLGLGQSFPLGIIYKSILLFCLIAIALKDRKNIPSLFLWIGYLSIFLIHFSCKWECRKIRRYSFFVEQVLGGVLGLSSNGKNSKGLPKFHL